jgi:hypothetical protein
MLYLAGSAIAFDAGGIGLHQVLLAKRGSNSAAPTTRDYMYCSTRAANLTGEPFAPGSTTLSKATEVDEVPERHIFDRRRRLAAGPSPNPPPLPAASRFPFSRPRYPIALQ